MTTSNDTPAAASGTGAPAIQSQQATVVHEHLDGVDIYVHDREIPWYQRSWSWGLAALVILICGLGIGWLLKPERLVAMPFSPTLGGASPADASSLLQIQNAVNASLENQIDKLQRQGDVCQPELPPEVARAVGQVPDRPIQSAAPQPDPSPGASPTQLAVRLADLIETATVQVLGDVDESHMSTGSGFFISPEIVVTNAHVVNGTKPGTLRVRSAALNREVKADLLDKTPVRQGPGGRDYALLKVVGASPANYFKLSPTVQKLEPVKAAGYPGVYTGLDPSRVGTGHSDIPQMVMRGGEVSVVHEFVNGVPVISHTAAIFRGNSGGPLVDACGRVVGINTFGIMPLEDPTDQSSAVRIDYAIGATDLLRYLDENAAKIGGQAPRSADACG